MLDGRCRTMPRMQPWRHFIPLKPDLSDALERRWAEQSIVDVKLALIRKLRNLVELRTHLVYKMLQSQRIAKVNRLSASPSNAKILPTSDSGIAWAKAHDEEAGRGRSSQAAGSSQRGRTKNQEGFGSAW